ncbi:MAG: molybdopterin-dependent oxidoreductase [Deltaproteobacteria bacterium]|nr:molybdopterin-dependent oxidoreductase [Deltaproteobacteria bacterium]
MKNNESFIDKAIHHPLGRRTFAKVTGAIAGTAAAASAMLDPERAQALNDPGVADAVETAADVDVRYSACLNCHSRCGLKVRVQDDTILKIDGNPWHPNNAETGDRLSFSASVADGLNSKAGTVCPKGQAGVEVVSNPHRLTGPLKRAGARGSGKWESISWDQALTEIADILRPYYNGGPGGGSESFLPTADGSHNLGTIANQVVFSPGRWEHGEKEFSDRLFGNGLGTVNKRHDHTSICETSHHVAGKLASEGKAEGWEVDMLNAEYVLWWGTNPLEANFPGQTMAKRTAKSRNTGTKHVIIDPRHSRAAAFGHRWLPVRPGGDIALALGIAQRVIAAGLHDVTYLEAANNMAGLGTVDSGGATKDKQYSVTDASYLVVVKAPTPEEEQLFLRDAGDYRIVDANTKALTSLNRGSAAAAQFGRIELDGTEPSTVTAASASLDRNAVGAHVLNLGAGYYAAPAFQLYQARVFSLTMAEYAAASGIDAVTIAAVAAEFGAAGRKGVSTAYRGPVKHFNGVSAMQAVLSLNWLKGNMDWKGGYCGGGGHLHEVGGKAAGQLSMKSKFGGAKRDTAGPVISRAKNYFDSTLASALGESTSAPTRRPWFPYALFGNYQEVLPGIDDAYPYPIGVYITYWNNIAYSAPAMREQAYRVLRDEAKLPHFIAFDIEMSETSSLADYILPDTAYLERWSCPHNAGLLRNKWSGFRQPTVGYYATKVGSNGKTYWESVRSGDLRNWHYSIDWSSDTGHFTAEDIMLELMSRVAGSTDAVPGFGSNAYYASASAMSADGVSPSFRNQIKNSFDWFWNTLVNWSIEAGADPSDSAAIDAMIKQITERGGWFEDTAPDGTNEYDGDYAFHRQNLASKGKSLHFFFEYKHPDGNRYKDAFSLKYPDPLPLVEGVRDAAGEPVVAGAAYPYRVVTYKPMYHAQGRTDSLPSLTVLEPENFVEMNSSDARNLDICNGDFIRLTSPSNSRGITGRAKVTERVRPGVVAISHSRGHWENSNRPYRVDGSLSTWDRRRGRGLSANGLMTVDPSLGNVCLQDSIGGSASYYDTNVNIQKVAG